MKSILLFGLSFICAISMSFSQQAIPNNDLESWGTSGSFDKPVNWNTSNTSVFIGTVTTVTKSTDAFSGSYSARLESKSPMGFSTVAPGLITLGNFNLNIVQQTGTISGGIPYNDKPLRFKGNFKYAPQGADQCFIAAVLYKYNSSTQMRDTLGTALFTSNSTVSSWTAFDVQFEYTSSDTPDSLNIIVMSSDGRFTPVNGSLLFIDNLSFEGLTTEFKEEKIESGQINIYPNPAKEFINIEGENIISFTLSDIHGKQICSNLNTKKESIKLNNLKSGIYFLNIMTIEGFIMKKIVVE